VSGYNRYTVLGYKSIFSLTLVFKLSKNANLLSPASLVVTTREAEEREPGNEVRERNVIVYNTNMAL